MSSQTIRIFIASPSDVTPEREIAKTVIANWNKANSAATGVNLMSQIWEENVIPQMGNPQGIINNRILKDADILVGIFWSRIGTPTMEYVSGSVEEIEKHTSKGKDAMLYFCTKPIPLRDIDTIQIDKLREYKKDLQSRGITCDFENTDNFKDIFTNNLSQLMTIFVESKERKDRHKELSNRPQIQNTTTVKKDEHTKTALPKSLPRDTLIFISGTNGAGKTAIASKLAASLDIKVVVPTNVLRQAFRSREDLFRAANEMDEYELLNESTMDLDPHERHNDQCKLLAQTIAHAAQYSLKEYGAIFEGINISPKYIRRHTIGGNIIYIMLEINKKEILLERLQYKAFNDEYREKIHSNIDNIFESQNDIKEHFEENPQSFENRFIVDNSGTQKETIDKILRIIKEYCDKRNIQYGIQN